MRLLGTVLYNPAQVFVLPGESYHAAEIQWKATSGAELIWPNQNVQLLQRQTDFFPRSVTDSLTNMQAQFNSDVDTGVKHRPYH